MVFDRILASPDDRFHEYVNLISALNIAYDSDREAFRRLMRGRVLLQLFPNHDAVVQLFAAASKVAGDEPYLYQQQGIYEMQRPNGNLNGAYELLFRARQMAPRDRTIIHSLAELELVRAEKATNQAERERHRSMARRLAETIRLDPQAGAYAFHTLLKICFEELREALSSRDVSDREVDEIIRAAERYLENGYQRFPDNPYLLTAEAEFGDLIRDNQRAFT